MAQQFKRFRKGKVEKEEVARYPVVAAADGLGDKNAIYAFPSKKAFNDWAKGTRFADKVSRANKLASQARKYEKENNRAAKKRQIAVVGRITDELKALSRRTGLDVRSKELLLKATVQADPLEGSVFDPVVLYKDAGQTGGWIPLAVFSYPNLGWFRFDNCASSLTLIAGTVALYERTWFRGFTFWALQTYAYNYNLADYGCDNMVSSVIVV